LNPTAVTFLRRNSIDCAPIMVRELTTPLHAEGCCGNVWCVSHEDESANSWCWTCKALAWSVWRVDAHAAPDDKSGGSIEACGCFGRVLVPQALRRVLRRIEAELTFV